MPAHVASRGRLFNVKPPLFCISEQHGPHEPECRLSDDLPRAQVD